MPTVVPWFFFLCFQLSTVSVSFSSIICVVQVSEWEWLGFRNGLGLQVTDRVWASGSS